MPRKQETAEKNDPAKKKAESKIGRKENCGSASCKYLPKNFTELPVEVVADIFKYLPRKGLDLVGGQCRKFRDAVGMIIREDYNELRLRLSALKKSFSSSCIDPQFCQKLAYVRRMELHLNTLDALFGRYKYDSSSWNIIAKMLKFVIVELNNLLDSLTSFQYFCKDIRSRSLKIQIPILYNFYNLYFLELEPILRELNSTVPLCIQLFSLLSACPSANVRTVLFDRYDKSTDKYGDYCFVTMFFELRGLEQKFDIIDFPCFDDDSISNQLKLYTLKIFLLTIIDEENGEFLSYLLQRITHLDMLVNRNGSDNVLQEDTINDLFSACRTLVFDTYCERYIKRTRFYCDDNKTDEIYRIEINRAEEIKTCVSSIDINLQFRCDRHCLPTVINGGDEYIDVETVPERDCNRDKYEAEFNYRQSLNDFREYTILQRDLTKLDGEGNEKGGANLRLVLNTAHQEKNTDSGNVISRRLKIEVFDQDVSIEIMKNDIVDRYS